MQKGKQLELDNAADQDGLSTYFSVVTLSPRRDADNAIIKKLQMIQMKERSQWRGIVVDSVGQPGQGVLLKGSYPGYANMQLDYEERASTLYQYLLKVQQNNLIALHQHPKKIGEPIVFRCIQENEMKKDQGPSNCYAKGHSSEGDELLYKFLKSDARLVRSVLEANGFKHTDAHDWNLFWANGHNKTYLFEGLNEYQKINHFPGSLEITRKDRLCENVVRFQNKYGKSAFYIIPDTYILPDEFQEFYSHFHQLKQNIPYALWIVKPNSLSRGRGIYLLDDIREVPLDESCIVSRYVANPLLINGLKFDLRIYAVMTSIDPLRIYVYNEGLTRFASERYLVSHNSKSNRYAHLTNYSVNKKNEKFVSNKNAGEDDKGNKWSISALCKHLESIGVDSNLLWSRIYDIIIKTILCTENTLVAQFRKLVSHRTSCFELFGFDVLIDSDLRPWLMEVNLSPSLAADSPLDMQIKSNMISDCFTLIGIHSFDRKKEGLYKSKITKNTFYNARNSGYKGKLSPPGVGQVEALLTGQREEYDPMTMEILKKLATLPPKMREILIETLEEYERRRNFVRIYPAKGSDTYDKYFEQSRPLNKFLYKYLYGGESEKIKDYVNHSPLIIERGEAKSRGMEEESKEIEERPISTSGGSKKEKVPEAVPKGKKKDEGSLKTPSVASNASTASTRQTIPSDIIDSINTKPTNAKRPKVPDSASRKLITQKEEEEDKEYDLLITGDDILIEYVQRLIYRLQTMKDYQMKTTWRGSIDSFCEHSIWFIPLVPSPDSQSLSKKLQLRLDEMKSRRKKLLKKMSAKPIQSFEEEYSRTENQKKIFLREYSTQQLEEMLKLSAKSNAFEVVSFLIEQTGKGVLGKIEEWIARNHPNLLGYPGSRPLHSVTQSSWNNGKMGSLRQGSGKSKEGLDEIDPNKPTGQMTPPLGGRPGYAGSFPSERLKYSAGGKTRDIMTAHTGPISTKAGATGEKIMQGNRITTSGSGSRVAQGSGGTAAERGSMQPRKGNHLYPLLKRYDMKATRYEVIPGKEKKNSHQALIKSHIQKKVL